MKKRYMFLVCVETEDHATEQDVRAYLQESVANSWGMYNPPGMDSEDDPGHPMWGSICIFVKNATRIFGKKGIQY